MTGFASYNHLFLAVSPNRSYLGRVPPKKCNIGLHKLQGHELVQQTLVARNLEEYIWLSDVSDGHLRSAKG